MALPRSGLADDVADAIAIPAAFERTRAALDAGVPAAWSPATRSTAATPACAAVSWQRWTVLVLLAHTPSSP